MAKNKKKAIVLLSGGLDSATTLYLARSGGWRCHCLIFDYGQRHAREITSARSIAKRAGSAFDVLTISLPWDGSALIGRKKAIPERRNLRRIQREGIPSTYVPARNTLMLSYGLSAAESIGASAIFIGANCLDYSGYPDCRPDYLDKFNEVSRLGTRSGRAGRPIKIYAPLLKLDKSQIISKGMELGVPYELTWSCYKGGRMPCGVCDSCILRKKGFDEAGVADPLLRTRKKR